MLQFIIYFILFYILWKVVKFFVKYYLQSDTPPRKTSEPKNKNNIDNEINKEDIIEADFEEIDPDDKN